MNRFNVRNMRPTTHLRGLAICVCVIVFAIFFQACESNEAKTPAEKEKYAIPDSVLKRLKIDTVKEAPLLNSVTLTGKVGFDEEHVVPVYSLVSGTVQDIKVALGDYVKAGQVLAVVKSLEMAGYSSDLINAQSNLRIAETNLQKVKDMYKSGLASRTDSLAAEVGVQQAVAGLDKVNRVLKINGGNTQGDYVVRAAISGFIVQKMATNNMTIRGDNSTSLFTISDLQNVWVQANVYESNISLIHLGDNVDVTTLAYPGRIFKGKVNKVMNVLDPSSKVMKLRVVLPNPSYALKPEMYASIRVNNAAGGQTLSVPSEAVIFDHSQYYVLIYNSRSDVQIRPVTVINTVDNRTFIQSGLKEGEKVICSDALLIYGALNS